MKTVLNLGGICEKNVKLHFSGISERNSRGILSRVQGSPNRINHAIYRKTSQWKRDADCIQL